MNKGKYRIPRKAIKALASLSFFLPVVLAGIVYPQAASAAENFDAQVGEHELCIVLLIDELGVGGNHLKYVPCADITTPTVPDPTTPGIDGCSYQQIINGDCPPDTEEDTTETFDTEDVVDTEFELPNVDTHDDAPINLITQISAEEKESLGYIECSSGSVVLTASCATVSPPTGGNGLSICNAADARSMVMNDPLYGNYFYSPLTIRVDSEIPGGSPTRIVTHTGNRVKYESSKCKTKSRDDLYKVRYVPHAGDNVALGGKDPQHSLLSLAQTPELEIPDDRLIGQYVRINTSCVPNEAFLGMVIKTLGRVVKDFDNGVNVGGIREFYQKVQFRTCVYSKTIAEDTMSAADVATLESAVHKSLDRIFIEEDCKDATAHEMAPSATRMDRENHVRMHDGYCGHEPGCISADAEGHDSIKQNADQMAAHAAMDMNKHGGRCEHIHPPSCDIAALPDAQSKTED